MYIQHKGGKNEYWSWKNFVYHWTENLWFSHTKKLSQEALAFESEIHPAYLGRVERGEKCPTIETLYKISKGLKIPLHELLDVSIEVKPTNIEAFHRIQTAMQCLSEEESIEIAEIVEKIIAFKYPQP